MQPCCLLLVALLCPCTQLFPQLPGSSHWLQYYVMGVGSRYLDLRASMERETFACLGSSQGSSLSESPKLRQCYDWLSVALRRQPARYPKLHSDIDGKRHWDSGTEIVTLVGILEPSQDLLLLVPNLEAPRHFTYYPRDSHNSHSD